VASAGLNAGPVVPPIGAPVPPPVTGAVGVGVGVGLGLFSSGFACGVMFSVGVVGVDSGVGVVSGVVGFGVSDGLFGVGVLFVGCVGVEFWAGGFVLGGVPIPAFGSVDPGTEFHEEILESTVNSLTVICLLSLDALSVTVIVQLEWLPSESVLNVIVFEPTDAVVVELEQSPP
jgi:hypothetical protein